MPVKAFNLTTPEDEIAAERRSPAISSSGIIFDDRHW